MRTAALSSLQDLDDRTMLFMKLEALRGSEDRKEDRKPRKHALRALAGRGETKTWLMLEVLKLP
jgi:hypothetical protein